MRPTFLHLPSGRVLNLDHLSGVEPTDDPDNPSELCLLLAGQEVTVTGADAALLQQALLSQRWLPAGGPEPLGAEALALVQRVTEPMSDAEWFALLRGARALLARYEGSEAAPPPATDKANVPPTADHLAAEVRLHRAKANGEYWVWQGDGKDYLDSLVCPVLIPAKELRRLLAPPPAGLLSREAKGLLGLISGFAAAAETQRIDEQDARDTHAPPPAVAYAKGKKEAWETATKKVRELFESLGEQEPPPGDEGDVLPAAPHPSHVWGPLTPAGQGRCVKCGAYRHLSSGFEECRPPKVEAPADEGSPD